MVTPPAFTTSTNGNAVDTLFPGMRTLGVAAFIALLVALGMPMASASAASPLAAAASDACHTPACVDSAELEQQHVTAAGCSDHETLHSDADHWHGSCVTGLPPAALHVGVAPPLATVGTSSTAIPDERHIEDDDRPPRSRD